MAYADVTETEPVRLISNADVAVLLPRVKEDPLTAEERIDARMLMLDLLKSSEKGITAQDYLELFGNELGRHTTDQLVSMFPEKEFNVFTLFEYLLNFVKVIMVDPKGFTSEAIGVIKYWKTTIRTLRKLFVKSSLFDTEEIDRVVACYDDIAKAARHSLQLRQDAENGADTESEISKLLPPLDSKLFASNSGKEFITRLREIYATALKEPNYDFLKDVNDLFKRTDLSNVTNSDFETDAAMRMIISMMNWSISSKFCVGVNLESYKFLLTSFATLNSSSFSNTTVSASFFDLAFHRVKKIQTVLEKAHKL